MNIKYWPTLKHIASVRIAISILRNFNLQAIKTNFLTFNGDVSDEYSTKIISKLTFLNDKEGKKIFGIVRSLVWELLKWMYSHDRIVYNSDIDSSDIRWFSYGIIDRFETAKILVRKESIHIKRRFLLACKYYLKDPGQTLWSSLSILDQMVLANEYGSVKSMWFWIDESQTDDIIDSLQTYHDDSTILEKYNENYLGLRCYFKTLGPQARYQCLSYGLTEGKMHHFDLYLCFAELNVDEAKDLFRHLHASNRLRVMELFLYWPLQFIFLEVLNQLWSLISQYNLRNIFKFILEERIEKGWEDVDYAQLVQNIWTRCPVPCKNRLKKDKIYAKIKLLCKKKC
ncbi:uncharacterized protein TNCT_270261 [Trichonephila clavata]|uniref:Uncharacterized protein n=1 Tax=Trichonephila clavata TaxID=2740835 RepID=A0A8X6KE44_TRICU|nr:uncharacterized protein TNCT_270261 [Trichonephila clavata]